jgi:hypothetical protein
MIFEESKRCMRDAAGRLRVLCVISLVMTALACGSSPSAPSGTTAATGTAVVDGQTIQFTTARNASGAGRRPTNPAWPRGLLDIRLFASCSGPGLTASIYDANAAPGRYEIGNVPFEGVMLAIWVNAGEEWFASPNHRGSSGSITVTSVTATRIAGSFSLTLVPRLATGTSPPTKIIEGTFDVETIAERVVC